MRRLLLVALIGCGGSSPKPQPTLENANKLPDTPPPSPGLSKEVCGQRPDQFGPIKLNGEQVPLRRGEKATKFAELSTTKDEPIEVCSPTGENKWLQRVTCNDGSAGQGINRKGNVGPGGLCHTIIDLYVATCPEKTYEIYMDMYMCGPTENFEE